VRLFPPKRRPRIDDVLLKVGNALWAWTLGRLIAMALIAVGSTAGLWMIGIPLPATLGVLAGVSNFVPNLGPLIASVPPLLFGLQQGGNSALYVAGFYLALQVVESYLITPLIDQQQVRLPPALTLAGQLLLGMIAGFMGLLLATPLIAAAHVVIRELYVKDVLEANA
jgi:predicted PurR-regulated permease PerM